MSRSQRDTPNCANNDCCRFNLSRDADAKEMRRGANLIKPEEMKAIARGSHSWRSFGANHWEQEAANKMLKKNVFQLNLHDKRCKLDVERRRLKAFLLNVATQRVAGLLNNFKKLGNCQSFHQVNHYLVILCRHFMNASKLKYCKNVKLYLLKRGSQLNAEKDWCILVRSGRPPGGKHISEQREVKAWISPVETVLIYHNIGDDGHIPSQIKLHQAVPDEHQARNLFIDKIFFSKSVRPTWGSNPRPWD